MTLSVIIPSYNVEAYIGQCLDSVFSLSEDTQFEVVCIDDGSTDRTLDIINEYAIEHSNIRIIKQQHAGASAARNNGILASRGDYIFFLDSDDFIAYPDNLQNALDLAIRHHADLCFVNALVDGKTPYINKMPVIDTPMSGPETIGVFYDYCRTIPTPVWIQLYRREFMLENNILQKTGTYHEDELFTPIAVYKSRRTLSLDVPIVHYRYKRAGAVTTQYGEKYYRDWANIGRDLFQFFSSSNAEIDAPFRQVFGIFIQLTNILYAHGKSINQYITQNDRKIMKECARTDYERKCYRLSYISPRILHHYTNNTLKPMLRKIINRFL